MLWLTLVAWLPGCLVARDRVRTKTASIWSYVFSHPYQFRNGQFSEYDGPVWPSTSLKKVRPAKAPVALQSRVLID